MVIVIDLKIGNHVEFTSFIKVYTISKVLEISVFGFKCIFEL